MHFKFFILAGSALAGTGVVLGAFAAHALRGKLEASFLSAFQTGVQYQLIHALALLFVGLLLERSGALGPGLTPLSLISWAGLCFLIGILLFCGSLYLLALGGPRWLGPVTPIGGLAFIIGWILLFGGTLKHL